MAILQYRLLLRLSGLDISRISIFRNSQEWLVRDLQVPNMWDPCQLKFGCVTVIPHLSSASYNAHTNGWRLMLYPGLPSRAVHVCIFSQRTPAKGVLEASDQYCTLVCYLDHLRRSPFLIGLPNRYAFLKFSQKHLIGLCRSSLNAT